MKNREVMILAAVSILTIILVSLALLSPKYAVGLFAAAILIPLMFFKPFYGLLVYIFLIYARPQDFIPVLGRFRIMFIIATAIILFFFVRKVIGRQRISFFATRQHKLMFMLLLIIPISNIVNGQVSDAWSAFMEFFTVFLLYYMIVSIVDDFKQFRILCWTLVLCTVLIAINGFVMRIRGVGFAGTTPVEGSRVRWIGIFGDANDLALAINAFIPFILVNIFSGDVSKPKKILLLAIGCILVATLFFTNSRGGFLAFVAILGVFFIKKLGLIKGLIIGVPLLTAILFLAPNRMGNISPYEVSAAGRVNAWIIGLVLLKSHPLLGVGFQNFDMYHPLAAHSAFIKCMAELGLIGYFIWLALLYTSFIDISKVADGPNTPYKKYAQILQLSFVGFLGSAVFLSQTFMPVLYILLALATLTAYNKTVDLRAPKFLLGREIVTVTILIGVSILGYKLLAMVYI